MIFSTCLKLLDLPAHPEITCCEKWLGWWSLFATTMKHHMGQACTAQSTIHGSCIPITCVSFAACLFAMFLVSNFESNVCFTSCLEAVGLNPGLVATMFNLMVEKLSACHANTHAFGHARMRSSKLYRFISTSGMIP